MSITFVKAPRHYDANTGRVRIELGHTAREGRKTIIPVSVPRKDIQFSGALVVAEMGPAKFEAIICPLGKDGKPTLGPLGLNDGYSVWCQVERPTQAEVVNAALELLAGYVKHETIEFL